MEAFRTACAARSRSNGAHVSETRLRLRPNQGLARRMLVRRRVWATHYTRVIGRTVSTFVTSAQVCAASAQFCRRPEQSFEAVIHPCRITDRHLRIEYRSGGDGGILMNSDLRTACRRNFTRPMAEPPRLAGPELVSIAKRRGLHGYCADCWQPEGLSALAHKTDLGFTPFYGLQEAMPYSDVAAQLLRWIS